MMTCLLPGRCTIARFAVLFVAMLAAASSASAQAFKVLYNFDYTDGGTPSGTLVQGLDGNLYGTTGYGGTSDFGVVFRITTGGAFTTLYSFCYDSPICTDGAGPDAGLVLGQDGNFYGTTFGGGKFGAGTVFKITPSGVLTTLYDFAGPEGIFPATPLVLGANGNFYGTTSYGGNSTACPGFYSGCGSIFEITPTGGFILLHIFNFTNGSTPQAPLIQASDGNFYGTAFYGGSSGYGSVFRMSPTGAFTVLHSFNGPDGEYPDGSLVQSGNVFYGTTGFGGASGYGTIFDITSQGAVHTVFSFDLGNGYIPGGPLVRAADAISTERQEAVVVSVLAERCSNSTRPALSASCMILPWRTAATRRAWFKAQTGFFTDWLLRPGLTATVPSSAFLPGWDPLSRRCLPQEGRGQRLRFSERAWRVPPASLSMGLRPFSGSSPAV